MNCRDALALARRGDTARARPHLDGCAACRDRLRLEERALEVARAELAVDVPPGHAARVARAALAAAPVPRPWWELALPVAWRAAVAANVVGAAVLAWALLRDPPPRDPPLDAPVDVDAILQAEADAMLQRALGLGGEGAP